MNCVLSNVSVYCFTRSNNGVSHSMLSLKVSFGWRECSTSFCLVTAATRTKLSMMHSITFLPIDNLDVCPDAQEKKPSSLHSLPNDGTDGESSTKRAHKKAQNSLM